MSKISDARRARRFLFSHAKKGKYKTESAYADNKGVEYDYKWLAKASSFYNVVMGCFKNGFPVLVPNMLYRAWAFYPFFFIRKNADVKDPFALINHERIHIRQQRDIHLILSVPLIFLCGIAEIEDLFSPVPTLCAIPFIPALLYGLEMARSFWRLRFSVELRKEHCKITFGFVRENTCFEREAVQRANDSDYLYKRKFWAVLAYK